MDHPCSRYQTNVPLALSDTHLRPRNKKRRPNYQWQQLGRTDSVETRFAVRPQKTTTHHLNPCFRTKITNVSSMRS